MNWIQWFWEEHGLMTSLTQTSLFPWTGPGALPEICLCLAATSAFTFTSWSSSQALAAWRARH